MSTTVTESTQALRQCAPEKLSVNDAGPEPTGKSAITETQLPGENIRHLHELQVHQIELEMQNDQLRTSQQELEALKNRYFELYDQAPVGYLTFSDRGQILEANLTAAAMLAVPRNALLNYSMVHVISPEDLDLYNLHLKQVNEGGGIQAWDSRMLRADGSLLWTHLKVTPAHHGEYWMTFSDITNRKQSENALRESEHFLRESQKIAGLGSYILDVSSGLWKCSEVLDRIFGIEASYERSVAGWEALIHPDDRAMMGEFFTRHVLSQGQNFDKKYRIIRHDNQAVRWVHGLGKLEFDDQGRPLKMHGTILDITLRKQARAFGEMGREVLKILNEPLDLQESIQRVIVEMKTTTGFDAVGIRLQAGEDFPFFGQEGFSDDFLRTENSLLERAAGGGVCRDRDGTCSLECSCGLVLSGKADPVNPFFTSGGSFWTNDSFPLLDIPPVEDPRHHPRNECIHHGYASFALVPIRNKNRIVGLIQFNDRRSGCFTIETVELLEGIAANLGAVLMRKQIEADLKKKNSEIEQFLYTVSHDLRSPLVTIKTFMGYLGKDLAEGNQEHLAQDMQFIHGAADKMKMMLDELLEMSRIDRVGTPAVRVLFRDILAEAVETLAGAISERKADFQLPDTDLVLFGDRPRLCQLWQNLIENAIKYSRGDSIPQIELGVQQMSGETVFFVRDNGIGIDPRYHAKIFGIFEKLNPKSYGAGLGLSMVQRIVEKCGGRVWVESEGLDKGSCFFFTLPQVVLQG